MSGMRSRELPIDRAGLGAARLSTTATAHAAGTSIAPCSGLSGGLTASLTSSLLDLSVNILEVLIDLGFDSGDVGELGNGRGDDVEG